MTTLRLDALELPAADLGPENPLPVFRPRERDQPLECDGSVPEEDRRHLGWECARRILPYRLQDDYSRERRPRRLAVAVLENEHLRATCALELGGRLLSLFDKAAERELLDRNPVFQPGNLALRNAWFSGGIEFNTPQYGHHCLTCSPLFAARVRGAAGEPVLRLYEWDRSKGIPFQIDLHLPPGSRFLFSRVRLVNPHDAVVPMYWWTNIAVQEHQGTRVICPAEHGLGHFSEQGFGLHPLPLVGGTDLSYARNSDRSREFYFHIPDARRRWAAAVESDGRGLVHTSTRRLRGRKVFYWGMGVGGRRWQDFLAEPGRAYLELQAGLARTQHEHLPMPPGATWEWSEAFGAIAVDPALAHGAWAQAVAAVEGELSRILPESEVEACDAAAAAVSARPAEELLQRGSAWGALERRRLAATGASDRIPAELDFGQPGEEQRPWLRLLEHGEVPAGDEPGPLMVQPEWRCLLEAALAGGGGGWLAWWHLGNMRLEDGDEDGARQAWETSLAHRRTGWALRNLAVLALRAEMARRGMVPVRGVPEPPSPEAAELLVQAWEAGPRHPALAIECARQLVATGQHERLAAFTAGLTPELRVHERMRIHCAWAALHQGRLDEVEPLFHGRFAGIAEGEVTLTNLWFAWHAERIIRAEGVPRDAALRKRVRREFPPPRHIDFRMHADPG